MTDKELIRQEIERRIKEGSSKNDISEGALALNSLLDFIDSLPEESASEDLEEEIDRFEDWLNNFNQSDYPTSYTVRDIARHFAEWQKQQMKKVLQTEYEKGRFAMREELMKDAIEGEVYKGYVGKQIVISSKDGNAKYVAFDRSYADVFNIGDRIKIIVIKED